MIAYFEFGNMTSNIYNFSNNFMTRYTRVDSTVPFISCCVKVGVANTTIQYLNLYIMWCWSPSPDLQLLQRCVCRFGTKSSCVFCLDDFCSFRCCSYCFHIDKFLIVELEIECTYNSFRYKASSIIVLSYVVRPSCTINYYCCILHCNRLHPSHNTLLCNSEQCIIVVTRLEGLLHANASYRVDIYHISLFNCLP